MAVNRLHIFYDIDCWFAMSYTEYKLIYSHILYAEHTGIIEPKSIKLKFSAKQVTNKEWTRGVKSFD